jgi:glycerophosphoryl diester phosphodiesterase
MLVSYDTLHPEVRDVTARLVAATHQHGHRLNVWTVNQPDDIQRLCALGVDGIITDDPRLARQALPANP